MSRGPALPEVGIKGATVEDVKKVFDAWIDDRVEWLRDDWHAFDATNSQDWFDVAEQVLANGSERIYQIQAQLLASALFKLAQADQVKG